VLVVLQIVLAILGVVIFPLLLANLEVPVSSGVAAGLILASLFVLAPIYIARMDPGDHVERSRRRSLGGARRASDVTSAFLFATSIQAIIVVVLVGIGMGGLALLFAILGAAFFAFYLRAWDAQQGASG